MFQVWLGALRIIQIKHTSEVLNHGESLNGNSREEMIKRTQTLSLSPAQNMARNIENIENMEIGFEHSTLLCK